jgi:hemophore-related protein
VVLSRLPGISRSAMYRRVAGVGVGCVLGGIGIGIVGTPSAAAAPDCSPEGVHATVASATGSARQYLDGHPDANQAAIAASNQPHPQAAASCAGFWRRSMTPSVSAT